MTAAYAAFMNELIRTNARPITELEYNKSVPRGYFFTAKSEEVIDEPETTD